ncbi:hypothetical protein [Streptomyces sp. NPDC047130]|uniref:hypothetical protein n=1 Tax=Streptomyces sp. NPDC047130 TaxID=3155261 RepID=UPI00340432F4
MTQSGHGGPWTPEQPDPTPYPREPQADPGRHGGGPDGGGWGSSAPEIYTGAPGPGPLPPETPAGAAGYGGAEATQYLPPVPPGPSAPSAHSGPGPSPVPPVSPASPVPMPPASNGYGDEQATQYIPPIPAADDAAATQYLPPVADVDQATQYLTPVPGRTAGDGRPARHPQHQQGMDRDTRMLRRVSAPGPQPSGAGGDAEATQYLPPVPGHGGDDNRQPPAEFDNLFRADAPRPARGRAAVPGGHDRPAATGRRSGGRVPMLAAAGVGIVVLGIGIGSLMAGGGDGEGTPVAAESGAAAPASDEKPAEDPEKDENDEKAAVKAQAEALDKLLADSGDSRAAVVGAVENVKKCHKLGEAAQALRGAAQQRADLVTRLGEIEVDRLPNHAALTSALTKAWQASKSADEHYANWADQVARERGKLCKRGQARSTPETRAAAQQSGVATTEKQKASSLWNPIAKEWKLTERPPLQL